MTWLGVWLVGVGLTDLLRAGVRPGLVRWALPAGVLATALAAAAAALWAPADLVALAGAVLAQVLWVRWSARAQRTGTGHGVALAALAVGGAWLVALSGWASTAAGGLGRWLEWADLPTLGSPWSASRVLVVAGLALANVATANLVVRLVLVSVGALPPPNPATVEVSGASPPSGPPAGDPARQLRGGRLLGPMERLLILGLGIAGQVTAAGLVIAAKGLIRFPELQAKRDDRSTVDGAGIDAVTEYFLVGSFVSWLIALASLVLTL